MGEEELAIREGAGAGIAHADFLADQVLDAVDAGSLAHDKLGRCAVEIGDGHDVFVLGGVILQPAFTAKEDMA